MTEPAPYRRDSDRWVTPAVVVAGLVVAGILLLAVVGSVTYLTAVGRDPDPMLRLVASVGALLGSLGTFVLQLIGRKTAAKTERNTGRLAASLGRHAAPDTNPGGLPAQGR